MISKSELDLPVVVRSRLMFQHQRHEVPVVLKRLEVTICVHAVCNVPSCSGRLLKAPAGSTWKFSAPGRLIDRFIGRDNV
jgi:hypothetical protein